jgi:hypothetical protein
MKMAQASAANSTPSTTSIAQVNQLSFLPRGLLLPRDADRFKCGAFTTRYGAVMSVLPHSQGESSDSLRPFSRYAYRSVRTSS